MANIALLIGYWSVRASVCASMHAQRDLVVAILSVVCPSVERCYHVETSNFFTIWYANHSCFWAQPALQNSNDSPSAGALNTQEREKFAFFELKSPLISETVHGYYGSLEH